MQVLCLGTEIMGIFIRRSTFHQLINFEITTVTHLQTVLDEIDEAAWTQEVERECGEKIAKVFICGFSQ